MLDHHQTLKHQKISLPTSTRFDDANQLSAGPDLDHPTTIINPPPLSDGPNRRRTITGDECELEEAYN